jgi:hypothetical protein
MATRKRTNTTAPKVTAPVEETPVATTEEVSTEAITTEESPTEEVVTEAPEETVAEAPEATTGKEPRVEELKDDTAPNTLKEAQAPELIQDQIRSKLNSRKSDETTDLFNPGASSAVAKAKMEELAKEQGFLLTRGREIGARLMARAKANRS